MRVGSLELLLPQLVALIGVACVLIAWIFLPAVRLVLQKRLRLGGILGFFLRFCCAAIVFSAIAQLSRVQSQNLASDQMYGLVIDASMSFDHPKVRDRLTWLFRQGSPKVCIFGSHAEVPGRPEMIQKWLGTHRTSLYSSLANCIQKLVDEKINPEKIIVYTDSRLKWDASEFSRPIHWVHETTAQDEDVDQALRTADLEQFLFHGADNEVIVEARVRGLRSPVMLGLYSPRGLVKTMEVSVGERWQQVRIPLSRQEMVGLEKGMPLIARFPKLAQEQNHENNEAALFPLWAPHKIRVLHVSGSPSTDTYYLRRWLKRQVNFEIISFYILKDFSDDNSVAQNEISLIPFPVEKLFGPELMKFDVVVLQNFEWSSFLNGDLIRRMKSFLETPGKGMLLLGGPRAFKSVDMGHPELRRLLPFTQKQEVFEQRSSFQSLPAGSRWEWSENFPIKKTLTALKNISMLPLVDSINFLNMNPMAKPWASVVSKNGAKHEIAASQEVGQGRVLMVTTDQLFRFVLDAADLNLGELYGQFFEGALSWLSFGYRSGLDWPLTPHAVFRGDSFRVRPGTSLTLVCGSETLRLTSSEWLPQHSGFCEVSQPEKQWVYVYDAIEEKTLSAPDDEELLQRLLKMGARLHRQLNERQWSELLDRAVSEGTESVGRLSPVWSLPWMLGVLLFGLVVEWWLRRRLGYL